MLEIKGFHVSYKLQQSPGGKSREVQHYLINIKAEGGAAPANLVFCRDCPLTEGGREDVCNGFERKGLVYSAEFKAPPAALNTLMSQANCLKMEKIYPDEKSSAEKLAGLIRD